MLKRMFPRFPLADDQPARHRGTSTGIELDFRSSLVKTAFESDKFHNFKFVNSETI